MCYNYRDMIQHYVYIYITVYKTSTVAPHNVMVRDAWMAERIH